MILNLLGHLLGGIGLDLVILNLTLKIVQERRFFRNLFSQGNGVGLRWYTDYMISKNGCAWFLWVLTCFALKMEFFWKSDNERRTLSKMVVKANYFANLSWIALYDWMKICEWLLGGEYDVYHKVMYFLLYLDCEKLYIELCEEVDIGECIYVNWLRCCWWIHIC